MKLRHLIPSLVVVVCVAWGGCARHDPCASTDGPQFQCWLEDQ